MEMPIRILIIDDEKEACELLETCVGELSVQVDLLGKAHTVQQGIELIELHQPDLVLLDVQMSPGSGFDILRHFEKVEFEVVFTTAYEEYAINAIRFAAIDYLLKPIDPEELERAIRRAEEKITNERKFGEGGEQTNSLREDRMTVFKEIVANSANSYSRIVLPTMDGFIIERTEEIKYCQADRNYTQFYLTDGRKLVVSRTMKVFDKMLSSQGFFRSHVSYLLNLNYIKEFKRRKKGGIIILDDGTEIPLSESRKKEFLNIFV